MNKTFLITTLSLVFSMSSISYGDPIESRVSFQSAPQTNVIRHTLVELGSGRFQYVYDPNHCSESGICTQLAPMVEQVELEVISDETPVDGPRVYRVTDTVTLQYSGWTNSYFFCSKGADATDDCVEASSHFQLKEVK